MPGSSRRDSALDGMCPPKRCMIAFAAHSAAIRRVLGELVLGDQGYVGLKRRLLRAGPRFLLESGLNRLTSA